MGILSDSIKDLAADASEAAPGSARATLPEIAGQGLRSGAYGAGAQLAALGGGLAQRYGQDPTAALAASDALGLRAAESAPAIGSYKDVHGLRDALDYGAGLLGQSAPAGAAALGAGALAGPAGAALALTPLEAGDTVMRQRELGQPIDAGSALQTGALSAGLQSIVPGIAGSKLAGRALPGLVATEGGLGARVIKNFAAVPGEAAANAGGEAVKQLGSGQATDLAGLNTEALTEAGIGGAVGGLPFAGAGVLGDTLTSNREAVGRMAGKVKEAAQGAKDAAGTKASDIADAARQAASKAKESASAAQEKAPDAADALMGYYDKAKAGASDAADRVLQGKPLQDDPAYASTPADSPAYQGLLDKLDGEHVAQVMKWGKDMLAGAKDAGGKAVDAASDFLTPERRAQVEEAMTNLSDAGNRAKIAAMEKARQAAAAGLDKADQLVSSIKSWAEGDQGLEGSSTKPSAKKSEDYSGVRKIITDEVLPVVQETAPGLVDTPKGMSQLADGLRVFMEHAARTTKKALPADVSRDLFDIMGDKTIPTLRKLYRAVQGENAGDTGKTEAFFSTLNDMLAQRKNDTKLYDVMRKSLSPELQKTVTAPELRAEADALRNWASRTAKDSAQDRVDSTLIRERLQERYGAKTDAVLDAVERSRKAEESALNDQGRLGVDDEGQPLAKAKADASDALTETDTLGGESDALDKAGLSMMRFKGGAGADDRRTSPRALVTNPDKPSTDVLDAVAMTKAMRTTQPYQDGEVTGSRRDARMFKEAVAKASEAIGRPIDPPDKTVINEAGLTWGEAKKFTSDRGPSQNDLQLQKLRDQYRRAKGQGDEQLMGEITEKAQRLLDARDAEISGANIEDVQPTKAADYLQAQGKESADAKNDNVHLAAATLKPEELQIKTGMDEQSLTKSSRPSPEGMRGALDSAIARMEVGRKFNERTQDFEGPVNKAAQNLAEKARALQKVFDSMKPMDQAALLSIVKTPSVSERAGTINALFKKYAAPEVAAQGPKAQEVKGQTAKDRLVQRAHSGDPKLIEEIGAHKDPAALQRAVDHLNTVKDKNPQTLKAIDALNDRIGTLVKENPDAAYGMLKSSAERVDPMSKVSGDDRAAVKDYLDRVLGTQVKRSWSKIMHAGEFDAQQELIRLSVHSLNPLSTAHHEAMHAFFHKMRQAGEGDPMRVLFKAADAAPVRRQLERLLAGEPDALKQLKDPEERAAYMYQFWAKGELKLGGGAEGVLSRLAAVIRRTLRLWSNDEKAQHILEYFHKGDFAKDPSTLTSLKDAGHNKVLDHAKALAEPLSKLSDTVFTAGGQRLRDTEIPALQKLADTMKPRTTDTKSDPGFIAAARIERTAAMNKLGQRLSSFSKAEINDALEALQRGAVDGAGTPEARTAGRLVRRTLDEMFDYMQNAGVRVHDLGVGKDYFPRVYDTDYISRNQAAFKAVLEKHGITQPERILRNLMSAEGNEFQIETMKPGMQHVKPRVLAKIPDAELAPFMQKDLFQTMNSYITQATRRGEWARRFQDDGKGLTRLLDDAKAQGATPDQLKTASSFVQGVDGTLGDHINPTARRLFGNMVVYQNLRLLPLAIFSSIVDPAGIAVRGGTVGDAWSTFKRGIREVKKNFGSGHESDASTQLAETMGVIDNAALVHSLGALYSQGMVGNTARKINDTFFRYNLMEQFNTSMRVGAMEAAMKFMQRHEDGKASVHSQRWMNELGLQKGDVKTRADGSMALTEADGLSPDQASRVRIAVNRWVDGAVLRPDAVDKPIWMNDPHWALVAHLKQFVYSFHETILKRVAHEFEHGNYTPAMALASYVPIMMASDAIKGLIQGGGQQPEWKDKWGPSDYLWSGVERAGLLGTGQFRADMLGDVERGGIGVGALAGPTIEQFTDAIRVLDGREAFKHFTLKSMPANALYASALGGAATDPKFAD